MDGFDTRIVNISISSIYTARVSPDRNSPMYLADAGDAGGAGSSTAPAAVDNKTIDPMAGMSLTEITALINNVKQDITRVDDMMVAEELLLIRYIVALFNQGSLKNIRNDNDPVKNDKLEALRRKYPKAAAKVMEMAAGKPLTKKAFSLASGYYFGNVYYGLSGAGPQDLFERVLSSIKSDTLNNKNDVDFEEKCAEFLSKWYNDSTASNKESVLGRMAIEQVLLARQISNIKNAAPLIRGWKEGDSPKTNALEKITCSRVSDMIKNKAGTGQLTKKAFSDASGKYMGVLAGIEELTQSIDVTRKLAEWQGQLDFTGIPSEWLPELSARYNKVGGGATVPLNNAPISNPIEVLTDPRVASDTTAYEELYAVGLVSLSAWLKEVVLPKLEAQLVAKNEELEKRAKVHQEMLAALAAQAAPQPAAVAPVQPKKTLQAEFTAIPELTYKGADLRGEFDMSLPYVGATVQVGRFSYGGKLGVRLPLLSDRLEIRADYGVMREQYIIDNDVIDPRNIQTASLAARLKVGGSISLKANSTSVWQYRNKFEKAASGLDAGIDYVSSRFYAEGGGRLVFNNKTPSYPSLEQCAYLEGGPKGFGPKWLNKLGIRLSYYGQEKFGGGIIFNGVISNGVVK